MSIKSVRSNKGFGRKEQLGSHTWGALSGFVITHMKGHCHFRNHNSNGGVTCGWQCYGRHLIFCSTRSFYYEAVPSSLLLISPSFQWDDISLCAKHFKYYSIWKALWSEYNIKIMNVGNKETGENKSQRTYDSDLFYFHFAADLFYFYFAAERLIIPPSSSGKFKTY